MKTIESILNEIRREKSMSRPMLYVHFKALGIKPIGAAKRPQHYPDDTAEKVFARLGMSATGVASIPELQKERRIANRLKRQKLQKRRAA